MARALRHGMGRPASRERHGSFYAFAGEESVGVVAGGKGILRTGSGVFTERFYDGEVD